jgi:large subunit ribosomal protein L15
MKLNELRDNKGARPTHTRVGRGSSSGLGKTCGRGVKGQGARRRLDPRLRRWADAAVYALAQARLLQHFANEFAEINLGRIQAAIDAGRLKVQGTIDAAALSAAD